MAKYLYDWDSVGYALAFDNFNLALAQPQSPGYIFYVAIGKMCNVFFNDPNFTMIFINMLFSILTIIVIYFLAKQMFSRKFALIASLLLVFNPIFWFYGEIAAIYISHALFASLIAYTSYKVIKGDDRFIYISAIVLGLSGGFRQDMLLFLFPLWIFCVYYKYRDIKIIFRALVVLMISLTVWLIPTLILAGGLENYLLISQNLFQIHFSGSSIFYGATIAEHLTMCTKILFWTVIGFSILGTLILIIFTLYKLPVIKKSDLIDINFLFILLWIFPTLIFYLLVYFAKPGYLLIYLPAFVLIIAYVICNLSIDISKILKKIPKDYILISIFSVVLISSIIQFVYPLENGINYIKIQSEDNNYQNIRYSIDKFNSNNTIIFVDNNINWRKILYYYPNYEIYSYEPYYASNNVVKEFLHYKDGHFTIRSTGNYVIQTNSSIKNILWIINDNSDFLGNLRSKIEVKTIKLPNGKSIYYSEVSEPTNIKIDELFPN